MKNLTEQQLKLLALINNFGYLTNREVAILHYPNSPLAAAQKAAQKALARLRTDGLILARELPYDGQTNAYVLTRAAANLLCDHHIAMWFRHGYDLSMGDLHARKPMMELLGTLAGPLNLEPVGARGIACGYQELEHLKTYDALLLNANGEPVLGIALIHGYNAAAQKRIENLSGRQLPFVIATTNDLRRERLCAARDKFSPAMAGEIALMLPPGVIA